ncbi:hypothetical protein LY78DRAFT_652716 [Colletotrichum sublineola]|nr:hypothetical protein LY78DRAFT_652716 [Colletotrichum sublineola]
MAWWPSTLTAHALYCTALYGVTDGDERWLARVTMVGYERTETVDVSRYARSKGEMENGEFHVPILPTIEQEAHEKAWSSGC